MNFLKRVFGRSCSHRFTWSRLGDNGQHYHDAPYRSPTCVGWTARSQLCATRIAGNF